MQDKQSCEKRFESMKQEASKFNTTWQDIQKYIAPTRGLFNQQPNEGIAIDHKLILDGTQVRDLRTLASGLTSGLTSPSRPWFKLGLQDKELMEYEPVSLWLAKVRELMMSFFSKSNIYGALYNIYEEIGSFCTGALSIVEDYKDVIRAINYTCGEYYLSLGADGRVNGFAREYWMTVSQLVEEFGIDNCSDYVRGMYTSKNVDQWVQVRHLIQLNNYYDKGEFGAFPFVSKYWEAGKNDNTFLKVAGFEEFPVLAVRWGVTSTSSIYGKGPGWDALGDVKMLQKLQRDKLIALDKIIDPPIQMDGTVIGEPNTLPGGITRFSGLTPNAGVRTAYNVQIDLNALQNSILETKNDIGKTFYRDLFLMISSLPANARTATEVAIRHEEKLLQLGPVLERLESELLDPLIDRTFNIMNRVGLIPPPPREIQGQKIDIQYISVLAQAQKMVGTSSIEESLAFVANVAGAKPNVIDVINYDEAVMEYCRLKGINPKITRTPEEVAKIRQAAFEAAQQAQQQANLSAAVQGAKALSQTQIGGNNALSLVGGGL